MVNNNFKAIVAAFLLTYIAMMAILTYNNTIYFSYDSMVIVSIESFDNKCVYTIQNDRNKEISIVNECVTCNIGEHISNCLSIN